MIQSTAIGNYNISLSVNEVLPGHSHHHPAQALRCGSAEKLVGDQEQISHHALRLTQGCGSVLVHCTPAAKGTDTCSAPGPKKLQMMVGTKDLARPQSGAALPSWLLLMLFPKPPSENLHQKINGHLAEIHSHTK